MTTFARELANAIDTSIKENRSVDIVVYTEAQLDDVICSSDDYADESSCVGQWRAEREGTLDAWGTDDYGEWRLRVIKRLFDADACKSLLTEAEAAGDWDMSQSCKIALGYTDGNAEFARNIVARAIYSARSNR